MKVMNGLDLQNQKITALGDAVNDTDAVNKKYVDNVARGLYWKQAVRAATTGNNGLSSGAYINGATLDGVVLATGDRILIKDQTTASENGIYTVNASGAPTRATDADGTTSILGTTVSELQPGTAVTVIFGTYNADKVFIITNATPITIGTTSIVWSLLGGGSGTSYSAGNGINISGSTISAAAKSNGGLAVDSAGIYVNVNASGGLTAGSSGLGITTKTSGGLTVDSTGLSVDTTIAKKYANAITAGSTSAAYTHSLNTLDIVVSVIEVSTGAGVIADWTATSANSVTISFASAPSSGQYRFIVVG